MIAQEHQYPPPGQLIRFPTIFWSHQTPFQMPSPSPFHGRAPIPPAQAGSFSSLLPVTPMGNAPLPYYLQYDSAPHAQAVPYIPQESSFGLGGQTSVMPIRSALQRR